MDPLHRTRLLRSTRKLEALLGTTPFLFDPEHSTQSTRASRSYRREGRVFSRSSPSPSSSRSSSPTADSDPSLVPTPHSPFLSLEIPLPPFRLSLDINGEQGVATHTASKPKATSKSKSDKGKRRRNPPAALPHPLVLCLRSVPVPAPPQKPLTLASTTTATTAPPPRNPPQVPHIPSAPPTPTTPASPLSPVVSEKDRRRRKMAKLTRTLGAAVPPELVFPASPPAPPAPCPIYPFSRFRAAAGRGSPPDLGASGMRMPTRRPTSTSRTPVSLRSRGGKKRGSEEVGEVLAAGVERKGDGGPRACGRRKEKEWSGEWNRGDMEEVVRALRGLRS